MIATIKLISISITSLTAVLDFLCLDTFYNGSKIASNYLSFLQLRFRLNVHSQKWQVCETGSLMFSVTTCIVLKLMEGQNDSLGP